jgi:mannitol-specific phosphotransferase system IIBC component
LIFAINTRLSGSEEYKYITKVIEVQIGGFDKNTIALVLKENMLVDRKVNDLPDARKNELNDFLEVNQYTNRIQNRKAGISQIIDLRQNW